jgi:hypothetical protein
MLDLGLREADFVHPAFAIGPRIVVTASGLDQHVKAHEETKGILAPLIVDDRIVDDERAAPRKSIVSPLEEEPLLRQIPVMQDMAHDDHFRLRQPVAEEIACVELDPIREAVLRHELLEDGLHLWQIEASTFEMPVGARKRDGHHPLRGPDIQEAPIIIPRKFRGDRLCRPGRYSHIKLPCGSRPRHPATDPALRMALHHAQDALQWRSGSVDLGPSGQACRRWLRLAGGTPGGHACPWPRREEETGPALLSEVIRMNDALLITVALTLVTLSLLSLHVRGLKVRLNSAQLELDRWRLRAGNAEKAVAINHKWHVEYDDTGTYEGSDLWGTNLGIIAASTAERAPESPESGA